MLNALLASVRCVCSAYSEWNMTRESNSKLLRFIHYGVISIRRKGPIDFDKSCTCVLEHPHCTSCFIRSRNTQHVWKESRNAIHDAAAGSDVWSKHVTRLDIVLPLTHEF